MDPQKIKILYLSCVSIIITLTVLIIQKYNTLPKKITTHIDLNGSPDLFGDKINLVYMLLLNIVLLIIFGLFIKYPKYAKYNIEINEQNKNGAYKRMQIFYLICSFIVTSIFSYMVFKTLNLGSSYIFLFIFLIVSPISILMFFEKKNNI